MSELFTALIAAASIILTAIAGIVGARISKYYDRKANTAEKKRIVKECVRMAEQLYKNLHGDEKKQRAAEAIAERLDQEGIQITALELDHMIEAAVSEFNKAFEKKNYLKEITR